MHCNCSTTLKSPETAVGSWLQLPWLKHGFLAIPVQASPKAQALIRILVSLFSPSPHSGCLSPPSRLRQEDGQTSWCLRICKHSLFLLCKNNTGPQRPLLAKSNTWPGSMILSVCLFLIKWKSEVCIFTLYKLGWQNGVIWTWSVSPYLWLTSLLYFFSLLALCDFIVCRISQILKINLSLLSKNMAPKEFYSWFNEHKESIDILFLAKRHNINYINLNKTSVFICKEGAWKPPVLSQLQGSIHSKILLYPIIRIPG